MGDGADFGFGGRADAVRAGQRLFQRAGVPLPAVTAR
jgi:hypothetical protein